jgi:hypothetical protein
MAKTLTGVYVSILRLALLCCCVRIDLAQDGPTAPAALPIIVPAGTPLHIVLIKKVPINHAGIHVEGKLIENVYVFDQLVVPAGRRFGSRGAAGTARDSEGNLRDALLPRRFHQPLDGHRQPSAD